MKHVVQIGNEFGRKLHGYADPVPADHFAGVLVIFEGNYYPILELSIDVDTLVPRKSREVDLPPEVQKPLHYRELRELIAMIPHLESERYQLIDELDVARALKQYFAKRERQEAS